MKVTLIISREESAEMAAILERKEPVPEYKNLSVIETFTADFGDGIQADIEVCNGDGPYVNPVLFHDGCEVCTADVTDSLLGRYDFEYAGETYTLVIREETDAEDMSLCS